jgi:hypothetical protein
MDRSGQAALHRVSPPRGDAETFYAKNCKLIEGSGSPLPVQT